MNAILRVICFLTHYLPVHVHHIVPIFLVLFVGKWLKNSPFDIGLVAMVHLTSLLSEKSLLTRNPKVVSFELRFPPLEAETKSNIWMLFTSGKIDEINRRTGQSPLDPSAT